MKNKVYILFLVVSSLFMTIACDNRTNNVENNKPIVTVIESNNSSDLINSGEKIVEKDSIFFQAIPSEDRYMFETGICEEMVLCQDLEQIKMGDFSY